MDKNFALYGTRYQVQGCESTVSLPRQIRYSCDPSSARVEVIERMDDMCYELLQQFTTKVGRKPETIIFFRDGVSEGQFPIVLAIEVQAIRVACQKLDRNYKPLVPSSSFFVRY